MIDPVTAFKSILGQHRIFICYFEDYQEQRGLQQPGGGEDLHGEHHLQVEHHSSRTTVILALTSSWSNFNVISMCNDTVGFSYNSPKWI